MEGITVTFGGVIAVDDISIELAGGECTALIGPNGAGKTTLLNVATGVVRQDQGRVRLGNQDISRLSPHRRARIGVARTFQRPTTYPELTVREHVLLSYLVARAKVRSSLAAAWTSRRRAAHAADQDESFGVSALLRRLGLEAASDVAVRSLPLGTTRLVALAQALVCRPHVLLLDEPSSGLTRTEGQRMAEVLLDVGADPELSVLIIEHDLEFATTVCRRMLVLEYGGLIADGTPAEILQTDQVRSAYLGQHT